MHLLCGWLETSVEAFSLFLGSLSLRAVWVEDKPPPWRLDPYNMTCSEQCHQHNPSTVGVFHIDYVNEAITVDQKTLFDKVLFSP